MATSPRLVSSTSSAELRKIKKPLIEKKRRERINQCLAELKFLVLEAKNKDESCYSKMEKADILEMTVAHLRDMQGHSKYTNSDENLITEKKCLPSTPTFVETISNNDDHADYNHESSSSGNNAISISVTNSEIKSKIVSITPSPPYDSSNGETPSHQFATGYFECVRRVRDYLAMVEETGGFKKSILKHLRKHLPSTLLRPKNARLPTCVFLSNITNRQTKSSKSTRSSSNNQTTFHLLPLDCGDTTGTAGVQKKSSDPRSWPIRSDVQFDESYVPGISDSDTRMPTNCIVKNPYAARDTRLLQAQPQLAQVWRPWNPD